MRFQEISALCWWRSQCNGGEKKSQFLFSLGGNGDFLSIEDVVTRSEHHVVMSVWPQWGLWSAQVPHAVLGGTGMCPQTAPCTCCHFQAVEVASSCCEQWVTLTGSVLHILSCRSPTEREHPLAYRRWRAFSSSQPWEGGAGSLAAAGKRGAAAHGDTGIELQGRAVPVLPHSVPLAVGWG